jgi:cell wall assembly regulator SMI1
MGQPLLDWIATSLLAAQATLRAPATEEDLARVGRALGHPLPPPLVSLYQAHDGQEQGRMHTCIFEGFQWLPLATCLAQRDMYDQVIRGVQREHPSTPGWGAGWLPFAVDDLGNAWVVDLASGRVFEFDHAEGEAEALGDSFEAFLAGYLASFASGERLIDAKLGVVRRAAPPAPPAAPEVSPRRRVVGLIVVALYVVALVAFVVWLEANRGR